MTSFTLHENSALKALAGTNFAVLDVAHIYGTIDANSSSFNASGPGAAFPGTKATVLAASGATVLFGAPSYSSTGI